ncbi:DUF2948 family protein [Oceanicella actignis]|uniref:DUF2948 family protein n=1 Tax=Oceanicella actignis TaxID=1189325 RepID=UPI0011E7A960|nr:DUF2948 family protein [Oceanicella actignis]TYO90012.1 Protein of unknown function (DUF2948) [Oceanicella actignis]
MQDARFEDAAERPLRLLAADAEDLKVMAALLQDAVGKPADIAWTPAQRRLSLLLNRFRWEDRERAARQGRPFERVRALLVIEDVSRVRALGLDPADGERPFNLLTMTWEPAEDGAGALRLVLSGGAELAVEAECLNLRLDDVTRPYAAPSGKAPAHPAD